MKCYSPVIHNRTGSTFIAVHTNIVSGGKITNPADLRDGLDRNVLAPNMGRLLRTRNEHITGQSTACYRMSNEHKLNVKRMKRTHNECLPHTTNIKRKNNEQTKDINRTIRTHIGQLPNIMYSAHSVSLRFKFNSRCAESSNFRRT